MINKEFTSILDLLKSFPDEQTCINHLEELRWNGNVISPFDSTSKVYKCKGNKYRCKNTGKYFNVRTATLFDNTKIELKKWFLAIYIITSHKKGISSLQLSRDIDVTQKTAWFMLQRIRNCFGINDNELLNNEVEIDETYIGGKDSNRHDKNKKSTGSGMKDKTPVFGMLERDKGVKAEVVEHNPNGKTLKPIIREKISKSATIITDGFGAYKNLNKEYNHIIVNHLQGEYVRDIYHTNTIEGFWSLLKRGIFGIYHFTSDKHLQKYVDEFTFRYNSIDLTTAKRFDLMLANSEHRLTYKNLIK
jgi:transposase-like protein